VKVFTAHWEENGKAGRRSFAQKKDAVSFAQEKARSADCGPVAVWVYENDAAAAQLLAAAHDRSDWWRTRKYTGTALKNGSWTTR